MSPISNASKLAEFGSGIGTDGAVLQVDNTNKRIGIGTTNPQSMLQVGTGVSVYGNVGIVSATEVRADTLRGDGSNITGVVGVGTLNVRTETVTTSGVSTFAGVTKVTDTTDSTSTTTGALLVSGGVGIAKSLHVGQNITIGGTLTYEDVTNIDSLGIVTARAGVNVSGGQFLVGSGVTIGNAGVATFSGTGDVHLLDNVQLNVGDGSDLVIKHDGSNSYITDSGSGGLFIQGSGGGAGITLEDPDGNNFLVCIDEGTGGTVELYKAGNKKLETTTTGATISGEATADGLIVGSGITFGSAGVATFSGTSDIHLLDNIEAKFGDAGDFIIKHNGSDVILRNVTGTGNIRLEPKNGELGLISQPDAETSLYYNNSKKIQTTNDGTVTTGVSTATGGLAINADSKKLTLGADADFDIYHSGSTNFITATTHNIHIDLQSGTENSAKFIQNGAVELYHNGTKTFETTSVGAAITSLAHDGGLTVGAGSNNQSTALDLKAKSSGGTEYTGRISVARGNGAISMSDGSSTYIAMDAIGVRLSGIVTASAGVAYTGLLRESFAKTDGRLSANTNIDLEDGMVHYFTTTENTTSTPNIRWNSSFSLNNKMNINDAITVTIISAAAAAGYSAQLTIDGSAVTEQWVGGDAPSEGGSDGYDIYTYNILKTADATFFVIGNLVNAT